MNAEKWITLFLDHLRIDKSSSAHTISAYERDLKQFLQHGLDSNPDAKLNQKVGPTFFTESDIQAFLKDLKKRQLQSTSIARKVSALKQFCKFLMLESLIEEDPTLFLEAPVQKKKLPKALSNESVLALLHVADEGIHYTGKHATALRIRDRAMIYLLYATGVRVTELISITLPKLDIESGYVRVMGKRSKERVIPFAKIAGQYLHEYITTARASLNPTTECLFVGLRGEPLTRQAFWGTLKKFAALAGIPQGLHPHMLRHTFATDLLRSGMNLRSLQMLLGHADLQTTQIYTHIAPEQLKEVIQKFHPRGGK